MGRDLEPGKVESMLTALQHWCVLLGISSLVSFIDSISRASTTSSVLSTLDAKLVQLAKQASEETAAKEVYDKQYQANVQEVQGKAKEVKPLAPRPVNTVKSGPTAAGLALLEKQKEKEREAERQRERERAEGENMDVDDDTKGKGRRCVPIRFHSNPFR